MAFLAIMAAALGDPIAWVLGVASVLLTRRLPFWTGVGVAGLATSIVMMGVIAALAGSPDPMIMLARFLSGFAVVAIIRGIGALVPSRAKTEN